MIVLYIFDIDHSGGRFFLLVHGEPFPVQGMSQIDREEAFGRSYSYDEQMKPRKE